MGEPIGDDDAKRLQEGINKHELTTRNAEEAARTAVETRDAARATVEALHSQERQLRRIDGHYDELDVTVTRAEGLMSWISACCCCKCCVPDPQPSRRVPTQGTLGGSEGVAPLPQTMKTRDNYGVKPAMDPAGTHSDKRNQKHLTKIGEGLGGPVEDHLRQETEKQDEAITTIEDVLGDLKVAALDMNDQLKRSEVLEERVTAKNERVHDRVHGVYQGIRRAT